jgi:hypothetical protein
MKKESTENKQMDAATVTADEISNVSNIVRTDSSPRDPDQIKTRCVVNPRGYRNRNIFA